MRRATVAIKENVRYARASTAPRARRLTPYFMLGPSVLYLAGIVAYPWLWTLYISFHQWDPVVSDEIRFVGFENYIHIARDPLFEQALAVTLYLTSVSVCAEFLLGLGTALLLNKDFRGRTLVRTLVLIPMMIAPAIAGLVWKLFVNVEYGLINFVLSLFGLPPVLWTASTLMAIPTVAIVEVWQNTAFVTLVLLAGLQAVPQELYEAALVDGASAWQKFRYITLPWLRPLMVIVVLFRTIFVVRTFETVVILLGSSGGPGNSAMVLGIYLFHYAFRFWKLGVGAAISYVILVITILLAIPLILLLARTRRALYGA